MMDAKVKATLAFAKTIKPGWHADILAKPLIAALRILRPRSAVAKRNMDFVFPGISHMEKVHLLDESYKNIVWTTLELFSWQRDAKIINEWTSEIQGREYIDAAFAGGRGVIFVTAHIGNWEHAAAWVGHNYDMTGIARHPDSSYQKELINAMRLSTGLKIMGKDEPMTRAVGILKKNGGLGIVSDQHGGGEGITTPFFGIETQSAQGAAVFAYLTGAPIIPVQSIRLSPFHFRIEVSPPITWHKEKDRTATINAITVLVNKAIENMVLRTPGQWLWEHRRFRERERDLN